MYEHQGIGDWLFVALYGAVAMMAVLAGVVNKRSLSY